MARTRIQTIGLDGKDGEKEYSLKQGKEKMANLLPVETIERKILVVRGKKVMLDRDLATLYQVKPIALRQQVKRNAGRFPDDFMFRMTPKEAAVLVSQNVIPSRKSLGGGLPLVFTEQGVAMLSSVLKSERAMLVNIQIMRAFTRLREMLATHIEIRHAVENLERRVDKNDRQIQAAFEAIRQLLEPPVKEPKRNIGFVP